MNIISAVILSAPTFLAGALLMEHYYGAVRDKNYVAISMVIVGPLFVGLIVSIFVEAGILAIRETAAPREALRVSAIANLTTYFLVTLAVMFLLPIWLGF